MYNNSYDYGISTHILIIFDSYRSHTINISQVRRILFMDIRQLKYFMAIAEEGQITSAARKLQMAQPPLSQQLKLL